MVKREPEVASPIYNLLVCVSQDFFSVKWQKLCANSLKDQRFIAQIITPGMAYPRVLMMPLGIRFSGPPILPLVLSPPPPLLISPPFLPCSQAASVSEALRAGELLSPNLVVMLSSQNWLDFLRRVT